jgi:hypothetical protein
MAKVYGPLGGTAASGRLGRSVVYAGWRGIAYARAYRIPHQPRSPVQQNAREAQRLAVQRWKNLSGFAKGGYNVLATVAKSSTGQGGRNGRKMSGYNLFVGLLRRGELYIYQDTIIDFAIDPNGTWELRVPQHSYPDGSIAQVHYSARPWFKWNTATALWPGGPQHHWYVYAPFVDVPAGAAIGDIAIVLDFCDPGTGLRRTLTSNWLDSRKVVSNP